MIAILTSKKRENNCEGTPSQYYRAMKDLKNSYKLVLKCIEE